MTITVEQRKQRVNELAEAGVSLPFLTAEDLAGRVPPRSMRENIHVAYLWDRPSERDLEGTGIRLDQLNAAFDRSERYTEHRLAVVAEREADARRAEAEQRQADAARRTAEADQIKAHLRERYLSLPGTTAEDFEREFPDLLASHRRREMDRMDDAAEQARQAMAARLRSSF